MYSEDSNTPACTTNTGGVSNSAQFNGYNVYVRFMGDNLYPYDLDLTGAWTTLELEDVLPDIQCFQPCPDGNQCDDGKTYLETFQLCGEYTGPSGGDPPGTWVPVSIDTYEDFQTIDTQIIQAGLNGCTAGVTMNWMGLDDQYNTCDYGLKKFHDIWGNRIKFEEWTGDANYNGISNAQDTGQGCLDW